MASSNPDREAATDRATWLAERAARRQQVMDDLAKPGASLASVALLHKISKQRVYQIKKMAEKK